MSKASQLELSERQLVDAIRRGDEDAFADLVERYNASMLRVARMFVASRAVAEDVVQETWLAVIQGIDRFEGRSSLKTWLFRILTNRAKTRGQREGRVIPASSTWIPSAEGDEPAVDPRRFHPDGSPNAGAWTSLPEPMPRTPDELIESKEFRRLVDNAIKKLPDGQREVITLRDVEGLPANDVCSLLGISEVNQRVLLHRARSKVRAALESYVGEAR
jgi:RNA polymerase sigma-70 factor (ECF subfamily)